MTISEVEVQVRETVVVVDAVMAAAAFKNAVLWMASDGLRPILASVLVEASADGIVLAATDSYGLCVQELPGTFSDGGASFLVARETVVAWVAGLKKRSGPVRIVVDAGAVVLELGDGTRLAGRTESGEFPAWAELFDGLEPAAGPVGFNPMYLKKIGSTVPLEKDALAPVTVTCHGPFKPAGWELRSPAGRVYGLLMPVRLT